MSVVYTNKKRPNYITGYAKNAGEAKYFNLWKGLVGAWDPDQTPGQFTKDSSKWKKHVTSTPGLTAASRVKTKIGYCFDTGTTGYNSVPHDSRYNVNEQSWSVWVRIDANTNGKYFMGRSSGSGAQETWRCVFWDNDSGHYGFYWWDTTGTLRYASSMFDTKTPQGTFVHFVGSVAKDSTSRIYLNGKAGPVSTLASTGLIATRTPDLLLGGAYGTALTADCTWRDALLWNRVLNPSEARLLYDIGPGGIYSIRKKATVAVATIPDQTATVSDAATSTVATTVLAVKVALLVGTVTSTTTVPSLSMGEILVDPTTISTTATFPIMGVKVAPLVVTPTATITDPTVSPGAILVDPTTVSTTVTTSVLSVSVAPLVATSAVVTTDPSLSPGTVTLVPGSVSITLNADVVDVSVAMGVATSTVSTTAPGVVYDQSPAPPVATVTAATTVVSVKVTPLVSTVTPATTDPDVSSAGTLIPAVTTITPVLSVVSVKVALGTSTVSTTNTPVGVKVACLTGTITSTFTDPSLLRTELLIPETATITPASSVVSVKVASLVNTVTPVFTVVSVKIAPLVATITHTGIIPAVALHRIAPAYRNLLIDAPTRSFKVEYVDISTFNIESQDRTYRVHNQQT